MMCSSRLSVRVSRSFVGRCEVERSRRVKGGEARLLHARGVQPLVVYNPSISVQGEAVLE